VALKKPLEYFKRKENIASVNESVEKLEKNSELNTFSDTFESFKNNLSKIEVLSDFSETLDNYRVNIERVNHLSESIEDIKKEIQSHLKKDDLDRVIMSQLLVVEESIREVQNKVKSINQKNLTEIRSDISELTKNVNEFLDIEVPKYKKLIVDSEIRTVGRYEEFEENVNETLEGIGEFVEDKYQELIETLEGINEKSLSSILEDFKLLESNLEKIKKEDIPRYKGFIVETERKTETKLDEFDNKLSSTLDKFEENINQNIEKNYSSVISEVKELENDLAKIKEQDIPKYKGFIVETEIKTESKINDFQKKLDETVSNVLEKISLIEDNKIDLVNEVVQKIEDIKNLNDEVSKELKDNEIYKNELNEKISDLKIEIVRNETHIKVQNKTLKAIQEEVKDTLSKINLEEFEDKSHKLNEKIKYLEEVFEKFNEKDLLSENIIVEPPSTDNQDPLTPLDKNFVTLEQLQQHYRLFINRIQQQIATIGGGGETRFEFLDDIDRNSVKQDGYVIQYNSSIGKFIGTSYVPGGGGNVAIAITTTAPTSPTAGNLWYDSEIGRTFLYYTDVDGSQWVDMSPAGTSSETGAGSSIGVYDGYPNLVGVVTAIDFGPNLTVSSVSSGIVTVTVFGGSSGIATYATTSGIATYATTAGIATSVLINPGVGIATVGGTVGIGVTLLDFRGSGISTVTVSAGIATINIPEPQISSVMMSMIF
jgi:DNA repair exonuclease SbcCD ATPase subunit